MPLNDSRRGFRRAIHLHFAAVTLCLSACSAKMGAWEENRDSGQLCLGERIASLPTTYANGNLVVGASIGGHPVRFILDTGTELTTVTPWVVEHFSLPKIQGQAVVTRGVAGSFSANGVRLSNMSLGPVSLDEQLAAVAPLPKLSPTIQNVIGVLGMDVLARFGIIFDLRNNKITLYRGGKCTLRSVINTIGFNVVPYHRGMKGTILLSAVLNGVEIPATLDTGATISAVNIPGAIKSGASVGSIGTDKVSGARGFGGSAINVYLHIFEEFRVGAETLNKKLLAIGDFSVGAARETPEVLLGLDFLKERQFIVPSEAGFLYTAISIDEIPAHE